MSEGNISALEALQVAANRIGQIVSNPYAGMNLALGIPARRLDAVKKLRFPTDGYDYRPDPDAIKAAKALVEATAAAEQKRGISERDQAMAALSLELDSLRAALPGMAVAAAIEAGTKSRVLLAKASAE